MAAYGLRQLVLQPGNRPDCRPAISTSGVPDVRTAARLARVLAAAPPFLYAQDNGLTGSWHSMKSKPPQSEPLSARAALSSHRPSATARPMSTPKCIAGARRCSAAAVNGCLFERARPEVLDLTFSCDPVLEFVARLETASFGEVVRCFSGHCVPHIRPAPDGGSLLDGPYRALLNRVRRPSVFGAGRLPQHLTRNSTDGLDLLQHANARRS